MKNTRILLLLIASAAAVGATPAIVNPSFEANYNDVFPHYGPIDGWIGGSGVNQDNGPFHNAGTPIPDRTRVAFIQGSATLGQDLIGFEPGKQYWLQFWYDARNCCGGSIDLATLFNETEIDRIGNVRPATLTSAPYWSRSVPFTPETDSGLLLFRATASGDATVVLDGITIVERDTNNVVVMNPSFEASGLAALQGEDVPIAGWVKTGLAGVDDGSAALADNGAIPEQTFVGYLEGPGALTQTLRNLVIGKTYEVSIAYNAKSGTNPRIQVKLGDQTLFEEDVAPVGGAEPYRRKMTSFTATDLTAVLSIGQTKEASDVLLIDDVRVVGETQAPLPPLGISPNVVELAPGQRATVTVTVPTELLALRAATLAFRSANTNVLRVLGANEEGLLSVLFNQGEANVKTLEIEAVGRGSTRLDIVDSAGLSVVNDLSANVVTSFVRNSSFESSPAPGGVGYGSILGWNTPPGGVGLNRAAGPFHDNGAIPDREQIAFIQNTGTISQEILGLTPGENYVLQFYYNTRNCCDGTINLEVRFDGAVLTNLQQIVPVGEQLPYNFQELELAPTKSSGLLEFAATAAGDATVLLDAVSIVRREPGAIPIINPSFEASGSPANVGYVQPGALAGWEATGGGRGINVNGAGPFTDNGRASDQDRVAFLQGPTAVSQYLTGFEPGEEYTLIFDVNGRSCCGPEPTAYRVSFNDIPVIEEEITPVGGANPFISKHLTFSAEASEAVLKFEHTTLAGDHTLLLDNIRIVPGRVVEMPALTVQRSDAATLRLAWPASASSFLLQSTSALSGGWTDVASPAAIEGSESVVFETIGPGNRYYRLAAP